jgi:hypothetical protein
MKTLSTLQRRSFLLGGIPGTFQHLYFRWSFEKIESTEPARGDAAPALGHAR